MAEERPFTLGSVWTAQFVRVKPGHGLQHWREIATTLKKTLDEQTKEGIVLSYRFLTGVPGSRDDFDVMLMVEYPNFGALDQQEKFDAITKKVHGSLAAVQETMRKREEIREAIGGRLLREIHLK